MEMKKCLIKVMFLTILIGLIFSTHYSSFAKTVKELEQEKAVLENKKILIDNQIKELENRIKSGDSSDTEAARGVIERLQTEKSDIIKDIAKLETDISKQQEYEKEQEIKKQQQEEQKKEEEKKQEAKDIIVITNSKEETSKPNKKSEPTQVTKVSEKEEKTEIDTSITSDNFLNDFNPNGNDPEKDKTGNAIARPFVSTITSIVNPILGVIQSIGGLLTIVSVAMFGFGMVLSGNGGLAQDLGLKLGRPQLKVDLLNFGRTLLIGSVLLFSSATLVKFVFRIFTI